MTRSKKPDDTRRRFLVIWGEGLGKPGGGTTHLIGLGGGLMAIGCGVCVVTPGYAGAELHTGRLDVRPVRLPAKGLLSFAVFQVLTIVALPWWLLRHRPSYVYTRTCLLQGLMSLICRFFGVPLIGEVDSIVDEEVYMRGQSHVLAGLLLGLDRMNFRLSHSLVCMSRGVRREAIRRGARPETTVAIPNGARSDVLMPGDRVAARAGLGIAADRTVFGFAGTFAPWQGLDLLLDALRIVRDRGRSDIVAALMGDGQLRPYVEQRIAAEGLGGLVRLYPPGTQEQVGRFAQGCDAFVIPIHDPRKLRYGFSALKFYDALAVGIPVIVPAGCEADEILKELNVPGTFQAPSAESLAEALSSLADRVEEYRARRQAIHKAVDRDHSWRRVARRVLAFACGLDR